MTMHVHYNTLKSHNSDTASLRKLYKLLFNGTCKRMGHSSPPKIKCSVKTDAGKT